MHNKRRPWPTKNRFFANRHRYPEFPSARASGEQATSRRLLSIVRVFRSASPDPSCFLSRDFRADRARARTSARIFQRHVARRSTSVLLLLLDDMRQRASHERCELRRQLAFHFRLTDLSRHARDRTKQIGATDKSISPTRGEFRFFSSPCVRRLDRDSPVRRFIFADPRRTLESANETKHATSVWASSTEFRLYIISSMFFFLFLLLLCFFSLSLCFFLCLCTFSLCSFLSRVEKTRERRSIGCNFRLDDRVDFFFLFVSFSSKLPVWTERRSHVAITFGRSNGNEKCFRLNNLVVPAV